MAGILILQSNTRHFFIFFMHALPGFHLIQDGIPFCLASTFSWHARLQALQPGPDL